MKGCDRMKYLMTVIATALAFAAIAQGQMGRGNMPQIDPMLRAAQNPKIAEKLGLTAEQVAKLKALADEKGSMKELQEKVRKGMESQAELLKAETVDEAAVMAALDAVWAARKEIAKRQTKRLIAVRKILSKEQITKVREAMKAMRGERKQGPRGEGKGRKRGGAKAESATE